MAFKKGVSANPGGKPKALYDRRVAIFGDRRDQIMNALDQAFEKAAQGDWKAIELIVKRFVPEMPADFVWRSIFSPHFEMTKDSNEVLRKVAQGEITPDEAVKLMQVLSMQSEIKDQREMRDKLEILMQNQKGIE